MNVRFRPARPFESLEPYAFLVGWAVLFTLPFSGLLIWAIAFAPDVIVHVVRYAWRKRSAIPATAQRSGAGVALLDESGVRIEGFEDSEVDAVTSLVDSKQRGVDLRVERKGKRALVFEVSGSDDHASVAKRLGIDIHRARSRYSGTSLAARPLALPFFVGMVCLVYHLFGGPDLETAWWLRQLNRFVLLPTVVLLNVRTVIDIGRDGVAWRWLWIRRYVSFASLVAMLPSPVNARGPKVASMRLTVRDGETFEVPLGKKAVGATAHLLQAFAERGKAAAPSMVVDEWLPRIAEERVSAWIQRLRAKSAAGGTYRGSDIRHLWPLAEDPATAHDLRCAMLLVLATTDEARERTRTLATQVVDPDVRAVFEGIADGANDAELAVLMERVSRT
ncbi:MAG: uncharacterized protein JWO86_1421 [Myxococcaceae bacterium]|nr:uncharacterized protein [Myxococcaceae bacterium]